jgi:CubicO group peptidase (beta-lactamase class C family)
LVLAGGYWYSTLDRETRGLLAAHADEFRRAQLESSAARGGVSRHGPHADFGARRRDHRVAAAFTFAGGRATADPGIDEYMTRQNTAGSRVIVQDGKIRFERYGLGFDADGRWTSFSVAKSFTSTLVGAAIQDGHIRVSKTK